MTTVYNYTMIGFAPHALSLQETKVVTPYATVDFSGTMTTTVTTIGTDFGNFIGGVWPYLLGVILLILFLVLAVRIAAGAFKRMSGLGRAA